MKKAIIFDMDGTLWDTTPLIYEVWNATLQKHEDTKHLHLSLEEIRGLMGKTMYEIGTAIFPGFTVERMEEIFTECTDDEDNALVLRGGELYPGLEDTLKSLKEKYHLYIVSNGQEKYAENFINFYGFEDLFEDEETFGRTKLSKADNIKLMIKRNNVDEAVYIGDTHQDETSAREAGVPFIFAAYGFGTAEAPDRIINSLVELPAVLEEMGF